MRIYDFHSYSITSPYKYYINPYISKNCVPSYSRYLGYAQIFCSINLFEEFNKDKKELVNDPITIFYGTSQDDLKKYKTYYIRDGKEQPYYKDFLGTLNRTY